MKDNTNNVLVVDDQTTWIIDANVSLTVPEDDAFDVTEVCYHAALQKVANSNLPNLKLPAGNYIVKTLMVVTALPDDVKEIDV